MDGGTGRVAPDGAKAGQNPATVAVQRWRAAPKARLAMAPAV